MIILPLDEIAAQIVKKDGRVHLVAHAQRVGLEAFNAAIEWYWYQPHTSRSRFYDISVTDWHETIWTVTSFPDGRLPAVRRLAKQLGLRIADGPPVMMGDEGSRFKVLATSRPSRLTAFDHTSIAYFPGTFLPDGKENPAIFTIENDRGSPVYKNRKRDDEAMQQASEEVCEILNRGIRLTPAEIADYIYGTGSFPNLSPQDTNPSDL